MKNNAINTLSDKICLKIKLERMKRNISQEELASAAGVNRNTIGKLERLQTSPTIETLEKVARVFNMDFIDLVDVTKVDLEM